MLLACSPDGCGKAAFSPGQAAALRSRLGPTWPAVGRGVLGSRLRGNETGGGREAGCWMRRTEYRAYFSANMASWQTWAALWI